MSYSQRVSHLISPNSSWLQYHNLPGVLPMSVYPGAKLVISMLPPDSIPLNTVTVAGTNAPVPSTSPTVAMNLLGQLVVASICSVVELITRAFVTVALTASPEPLLALIKSMLAIYHYCSINAGGNSLPFFHCFLQCFHVLDTTQVLTNPREVKVIR